MRLGLGLGTVCLTEDLVALRRWMVATSDLARMVEEFKEVVLTKAKTSNPK